MVLGVGADHERFGAVRVDVVRTGLRVVLDDEDRGGLPVLRVRDEVDEPADRQVIVGDYGLRGGRPRCGAAGVILR